MSFSLPMHKRVLASVAASVLTFVAVGSVSHARGMRPMTYSGTNGPLVYYGTIGSGPSMTSKLMASTLTGTEVPTDLRISTQPEFSADGSKVVYLETAGSNWSVRTSNADGTNLNTVLSGTGSVANNPTFSPNGNFIAFDYSNDIYVISASSTNKTVSDATRLTTSSGMGMGASKPKYLSATKIAYVGAQPGNSCSSSLYNGIYVKDTMAAGNGSLLTNSCDSGVNRTFAIGFDVSPDGQWILYRGLATKYFFAAIKSDNTGSRITAYTGTSFTDDPQNTPTFSPDGTKVLYDKGTSGGYVVSTFDGSTFGSPVSVVFPTGVRTPAGIAWAPASAVLSATTTTTAPATTTTVAPTTTVKATTTTAAATTTTTTSPLTAKYAAATPGVTVTDNKVYNQPPAQVADDSAIRVLSIAQNKTLDIETKTPSVCLPNDDELIFLNEGTCISTIVNARTRAVLRTLRTTVVADDISEVKVGNAIVTLAPIYFKQMSSFLDDAARARIDSIKKQVNAAGSILVVGYSGTRNGNSPENVALSRARAASTVTALKLAGAKGPFAVSGVGALDPVSRGTSEAEQAKNRRVVIVLIP